MFQIIILIHLFFSTVGRGVRVTIVLEMLRNNLWADFHKIIRKDRAWYKQHLLKFGDVLGHHLDTYYGYSGVETHVCWRHYWITYESVFIKFPRKVGLDSLEKSVCVRLLAALDLLCHVSQMWQRFACAFGVLLFVCYNQALVWVCYRSSDVYH